MTWSDVATASNTAYIMLSMMLVAFAIIYFADRMAKKDRPPKKS